MATAAGYRPAGIVACLLTAVAFSACTTVGPEYERPTAPLPDEWRGPGLAAASDAATAAPTDWWRLLRDDTLDRLVAEARSSNNTLEIVGLRILEARARLALATGTRYPQTQVLGGSASANRGSESAANTAAGDLEFTQYDVGMSASWELDFWGRFRRGIEAADAAFLGSIAAYEEAILLLDAQVAANYVAIRTLEEQIRITYENIANQERSYEIVDVQYRNGNTSELDVLQARALLLGTKAAVPGLEAQLRQAMNAMNALLARPPGTLGGLLESDGSVPGVPETTAVGIPADLLRRRPDIRRAEYTALARNAQVGLAAADLYPSFSIRGSFGLVAAGNTDSTRTGNSGLSELFSGDSLTYSAGAGFVWPFFNYGRIRNNIRVQDARLQQALTAYREAVIQAAREVEDAIAALDGALQQEAILDDAVIVAQRAAEVALLRFREGFADYQRVLDAQEKLFDQQLRYVANRGNVVTAYIGLAVALGGGPGESFGGTPVSESTRNLMQERTDWGDLIEFDDPESATPDR